MQLFEALAMNVTAWQEEGRRHAVFCAAAPENPAIGHHFAYVRLWPGGYIGVGAMQGSLHRQPELGQKNDDEEQEDDEHDDEDEGGRELIPFPRKVSIWRKIDTSVPFPMPDAAPVARMGDGRSKLPRPKAPSPEAYSGGWEERPFLP